MQYGFLRSTSLGTVAWICLVGLLGTVNGPQASAAAPSATTCRALLQLSTDQLLISKAQLIPAGPLQAAPMMGPPAPPIALPEHCLVQGTLAPRTGVGGKKYGIGFELRLPTQWNGRFLFQGGGGLEGFVQPAVGSVGVAATPALARGFAVVSMDGGHRGFDASFALDQQARLDFAYAALGKVTDEAKAIIAGFYGARPSHSYFVGCSSGGREAMMAAQRYPDDFDGIVAGDPGFRLSAAAVGELWDTVQFSKVAPRDAQGRPILSQAFTDAQLKLVSNAVLRQCDALDGLADGMINNVGACHFNPAVLTCKPGADRSSCLSGRKVAALQAVFGGAHNSTGRALYSDWPFDAGIAGPGWRAWKLGNAPSGAANAINATLGLMALQDYFFTPPQPGLLPAAFNFDRAAALTAQTAAINDATATFMSSFVARGGRLLIYQGMSDPVFSADDIIHWYGTLAHDAGPPQDWARLYLVPGMNHCGGGPATDDFDVLSAIQGWTERGDAPDRIVARGRAFPGATRPLCPFPKYARYVGGDRKSATSFQCE